VAGTGVIDQFLETFTRYIDSGFGLLGGEVAYVATTLAAIDITLAALFWAWGPDEDIIARLVKKTLFVGVFAYLIGNWNSLARIVFESFAGLGLKASGTGLSSADFLRPGRIAQVGIDAGRPILDSISELMGYISFFENFVQIVVLLFAWIVVLLAFFILAIQLFVTLIEFKLTTLAGFVLIPFGLFGKTAFAAERVLGNVISSGVKVLVLAVIVGIGSTLFSQFTSGFGGNQPTIENAMALVLAALSLLGLGIFGPGIANGIVSGGPQLGAGAAIGTGLAAGGVIAAGAGLAAGGVGLAGGAFAGAARGTTAIASGAAGAFRTGGLSGVAEAGASAVASPLRRAAASLGGASNASGNAGNADPGSVASAGPPAWARRMKRTQTITHSASTATHAVRAGDHAGGGTSVGLSEGDR
jgi:type IV secretion system protein TrbL